MKVLSDIIYLYIIVYSIFFVYLTIKNLSNKKFQIIKKYEKNIDKKNLCLIIYTHNSEQKLRRMLECLKQQDYPAENTSIFVILDNCDDNSEKINFDKNVQKFAITNKNILGKKQAISILIERIKEYSVIDAFVFLDINRYIEKDFLLSVNAALNKSDVISGATFLFGENLNIKQKIKAAYQKYRMNFIEKARSCANLYTKIDSGVCAIKRTIIDNTGLPDFKSIENDLEYTLNLAKGGYSFSFDPNIKTYCEVHDFAIRIPKLLKRINLFTNNVLNILSTNSNYAEFTLHQLSPNIILIIIAFAYLSVVHLDYCLFASFSVTVIALCTLIISFALSLIKSKMKAKEVLYLLLYPIYSLFHVIKHIMLWPLKKLCQKKSLSEYEEKFEIEAEVTDGRALAPCKLIIINEYGMSKVKFVFKNKEISTKTHLRTFDAIEELINRLEEYGFTIKICQACSNFSSNYDGSTNLIKGFCKKQFQVSQDSELSVVVWNSCRGFNPKVIVKNYRN